MLAAPFVGSVLGVLIRRLPAGRPVVVARSACEGCGAVLGPRDLVPLLSYAALRGRCRRCGAAIGWFHPAIELAAIGVAVWARLASGDWADCVLGWGLLALAWIDWDHFRLPDALTLPLIPIGLLAHWDDRLEHAVAAVAGYALFRAVAVTYLWLRQREGLGVGDAKLLAVAGAWVGVAGLPWVVFGGGVFGIVVALMRGGAALRGGAIPFGPPLCLAIWLVRLYGP